MQVKIYINDKLYKTVTVNDDEKYEPNSYWDMIQSDKENGVLATYNVDRNMAVRFEPVK